jgi:dCMP deaminase
MTRPSWDELWLRHALLMAERSLCATGVGAVVVDSSQRVIQSGYSGPPAGYSLQDLAKPAVLAQIGCQAYCERALAEPAMRNPGYLDCPSSHAEMNTIARADGSRMLGGSFYVSSVPCFTCAKVICNTGVVRVLWHESDADVYRDPASVKLMFDRCRVAWKAVA